ncbi:MAG: metallophosphoesterase [Clostridiales bacterium]|nr:metallophosphoesterase [Clostridiales bacterium]
MKKILCFILSLLVVLSLGTCAFAADAGAVGFDTDDKSLKFNDDGTFKILMINDSQDVGKNVQKKMIDFLVKAVETEKPDLVVFVGDQLADVYPFATAQDYALSIENICKPLEDRGVPFLATLGNHDHDRANVLNEEGQYELYNRFNMNYASENGPDPFTYNVEVKTHDGRQTAFNIYMMDTNNKATEGGYSGITEEQLSWYNNTCASLKEANGGAVVPSILFQHIPVKEIYKLFKECDWNTPGAIYSRRDTKWYVLDENKVVNDGGTLGEAPCSENFDHITGQYQAWVKNGDIMGAFFGHDHVNTFMGTTEDGIKMGYNGGSGFRAYGDMGRRTVRVFEFKENDVTDYETRLVYHDDLMAQKAGFVLADFFSPSLLTTAMKVVYFFFGWAIKIFAK